MMCIRLSIVTPYWCLMSEKTLTINELLIEIPQVAFPKLTGSKLLHAHPQLMSRPQGHKEHI